MILRQAALALAVICPWVASANAQEPAAVEPAPLHLELNAAVSEAAGCRLSFLARNQHAGAVDKAVYEAVLFDQNDTVNSFILFDFEALPQERPRVRQFIVPQVQCEAIGRILINGASECIVSGETSPVCSEGLSISTRIEIEVIG